MLNRHPKIIKPVQNSLTTWNQHIFLVNTLQKRKNRKILLMPTDQTTNAPTYADKSCLRCSGLKSSLNAIGKSKTWLGKGISKKRGQIWVGRLSRLAACDDCTGIFRKLVFALKFLKINTYHTVKKIKAYVFPD